MDNEELDMFFGCLMGLVVFFAVAIAIVFSTTPPAPLLPVPIRTTELYTRLVRVCNAIDITDSADCNSIIYLELQNRGMMP